MKSFKILFTLSFAFAGLSNLYAQSGCGAGSPCNLISNPFLTFCNMPPTKATSGYTYRIDPINPWMPNQYFDPWYSTHGSPHAGYKNSVSAPSHFVIGHEYASAHPLSYSEGFQQGIPTLQAGKQYIFAINHKMVHGSGSQTFVAFTDAAPNDVLAGRFQAGTWPVNTFLQQPVLDFWSTSSAWTGEAICITPTSAWTNIWIYAARDSLRYNGGTFLDDIELIENFNFARGDTSICDTMASVDLTTKCDSFLNLTPSYVWKNLNTNTIIGYTRTVSVSPNVTTQYEVTRNFTGLSCPAKDTVTVTIDSLSLPLNLGPDTSLCWPHVLSLNAGHWGPGFGYRWYKNGILQNDTMQDHLVTKSGSYMVELISPQGCIIRDTIQVDIFPEVNVYPDTMIVCDPTTIVEFDAGPGFLAYQWDGNPSEISQKLHTNMIGIHWVTVTDTNGCTGMDTALLELQTFSFDLGPDTVLCEGVCAILKAPYDTGHSYLWNGGGTNFDTLACDSGVYWVTVTDSLGCTYTDTLRVYIHPKQISFFPDQGPFCYNDTIIVFIDYDQGGSFSGSPYLMAGQDYWIGSDGAPPGIDSVTHIISSTLYINGDSSKCYFADSFSVTVIAPPNPQIDTLGPYCFADYGDTLTATPPGGIFKDSLGTTINFFSPDSFGAGLHHISYEYTDSNGCKGYDSMYIQVNPEIIIAAKGDTSLPCIPVSGINIWVNVSNYSNDTLYYLWSTGDTTTSSRAYSQGWYWVTVFDKDSICSTVDSIYIDKEPCCAMPATDPYFGVDTFYIDSTMGLVTIANETLYIETVISIEPSAQLEILNSHLTMLSCSKIVVKRGGLLTVDNSYIGGCGWHGIEVWGNWDACSDDYSAGTQGRALLSNSDIRDADIGVFLGKRIGTDYDPLFVGGVLESDACHYKYNYVDIMFTPWAVGNICQCTATLNGQKWQSKIENNVFDTLADDYYCEPFVDSVINRIDRFFQHPFGNPPFSHFCSPAIWWNMLTPQVFRCHIVDLSPFVEYDIIRTPILQCIDACPKNAWTSSRYFGGNSTQNNSYLPANGCSNIFPADKYN